MSNSFVYFIAAGDAVKIGRSADPIGRLQDLQTGHAAELKLLGVIPDGSREAEFHARFAHLRINKEWFRLEADLELSVRSLEPIVPARIGKKTTVKLPSRVLRKAKIVAAIRNISLYDYLESVLRPAINEDWDGIIKKEAQ